ncbi:MAG: Mrp/NBP35 family ATP-binding protein [Verrucomicrobia bacterium]|nr:Mrp/NBP35 family ATP-binding protein [Verrucomicrobiota bacterium]
MPLTENQIRDALKQVKYPGFSRDIVSFGIVKNIELQGNRCNVQMSLTTSDPKIADQIKTESEQTLHKLAGIGSATVTVNLQAAAPGVFQQQRVQGIRHSVAVASGKGGVGKSTVAVNLSLALSRLGARVGLMDCDIYGPSIPLMMNVKTFPTASDDRLNPIISFDVKLMSMGFLVDPDSPVIWRGPMVTRTVQQFVHHVAWGDLDYLVIDLPPGTGDAQLSLCQTLPLSGAVMVTTPQEVALIDVRKAIGMFQKVNVPILGIVENMSFFLCPSDNKRYDIFGAGGGQREADRLGVPLMSQIPIEMAVREGGDAGIPLMVGSPQSTSGRAFLQAAEILRKKLP